MKGLFITTRNMVRLKQTETGIYNKITSQIKIFQEEHDVKLLSYTKIQYYFFAVLAKIPGIPFNVCWNLKAIGSEYDFIYYRFETGNPSIVRLIKKLKEHNPFCKVIVEFSVYPMNWDVYSFVRRLAQKNYNKCAKRIAELADRTVVYGSHEEAFGIPAIKTENGIDFDSISLRINKTADAIRVVSVSKMLRWHRIDRFISGLYEYYKNGGKRDIIFHVVGSGTESESLKKLVETYGISDRIIFHGYKSGAELESIMNDADLALDGLTEYEKQNSSLKSREYFAKGLPVITSNTYAYETEQIKPYLLKISCDDSPVDMEKVVSFFDSIYCTNEKAKVTVAEDIRKYAQEYFSMTATMCPIMNFIKESLE